MGDITSVGGGGGVGFVGGDEISEVLEVLLGSFGWIVEEDKKKIKSWCLLLMAFCGEGENNYWFFLGFVCR